MRNASPDPKTGLKRTINRNVFTSPINPNFSNYYSQPGRNYSLKTTYYFKLEY